MPQLLEPFPSDLVAQLGFVAEGEEGLLTAHRRGGLRLFDQLRSAHERLLPHLRRAGEDAVVANVSAEVGEGKEDLLRVTDQVAVARITKLPGHGDQSCQVRQPGELGGFLGSYSMSLADSPEKTAHHPPSLAISRGIGKTRAHFARCKIT